MPDSIQKRTAGRGPLILFHMGLTAVAFALSGFFYFHIKGVAYLLLSLLFLTAFCLQLFAWTREKRKPDDSLAIWIATGSMAGIALLLPMVVRSDFIPGLLALTAIPMFITASGRLKQLPAILFFTFIFTAVVILFELFLPQFPWMLTAHGTPVKIYAGIGFSVYLVYMAGFTFSHYRRQTGGGRIRVNVATQYALVITSISALVVLLVTGVMIQQIRKTQINEAGSIFKTISENFATLVGYQIEQQTRKLHLLTQQVPIFKSGLTRANAHYSDAETARSILRQKNRKWTGPGKDIEFVMQYLNNPITRSLSLFRGHNSFHNDLILVDRYGGLVGSLGKTPEAIYFFDRPWWQIAWNKGLGNIFIGELSTDRRTRVPKIRIAVDIVDTSTNEHIGVLSSTYLLRTVIEDIRRSKPDTVDQISLIDQNGDTIITTIKEGDQARQWADINRVISEKPDADSGWFLGRDSRGESALIGYSSLRTAYSVISDPLHRLGWHIVVSGSRAKALTGVNQSTKLAIVAGLVIMAMGVIGGIAAARVITRPIENLTETASAMGEGRLEIRAPLEGPEELVTLSDGFNRLTDRLNGVIRDLKVQTGKLDIARQEAEAATRLKGEFLAKMSHEIRTPLNAILGFTDILESGIEDPKQKRHARIIRSSGADLLDLINDILDLSKIEAGHMTLQKGPVDINRLFDELGRIFSISVKEKNIGLDLYVSDRIPTPLILDRIRLRQVLFNLIGNAVKFTDHGRVSCTADPMPCGHPGKTGVKIRVKDTGAGIPPHVYDKIFKAFEQHHGDRQGALEGTGLGLAISRNLIEMMNGNISVTSEFGQGSVFTIQLPEVDIADEGEPANLPRADAPFMEMDYIRFQPALILIADDLEVNRQLIIETLNSHPLTIIEAAGGREAVERCRTHRVDLVLMDIRMPELDGYQALAAIKARMRDRSFPVIAITAGGMKEDVERITRSGFDDYLIRPFSKTDLLALLCRYLPHGKPAEASGRDTGYLPLTAESIRQEPPWHCPEEASTRLKDQLTPLWRKAVHKQSIPLTADFAREIRCFGEEYHISVLTDYGTRLQDCVDAFDIQGLETLLNLFKDIVKHRR